MRDAKRRLAMVALLALFAVQALLGSAKEAATFDEVSHIAAGVSYWRWGDYRLDQENGAADQRWIGLPAALVDWRFPSFSDAVVHAPLAAWRVGFRFLYRMGNDAFTVVQAARLMNVLAGLAVGALVWLWSARLYGPAGALLSLGLFAFCPNLLAHGGLANSDLPMAAAVLWLLWVAVKALQELRLSRALGAGALLGLSLAVKASGALALPVLSMLLLVRIGGSEPWPVGGWLAKGGGGPRQSLATRGARAVGGALLLIAVAAAATAVIWAIYGFRYTAALPGAPGAGVLAAATGKLGGSGRLLETLAACRLLPEGFLTNYALTLLWSRARLTFALGEVSGQGWWWYFPAVFLAKSTLTTLAVGALALAGGVTAWRARRRPGLLQLALLATLALVWGAAIRSHLNLGLRHVIITYPIIYILAGGLVAKAAPRRGRLLTGLLLALQVAESATAAPHYLAFFNAAAGGPAAGYRLFVDSNLDWGQDLPSVKPWLEEHRLPPDHAYLAYFGAADPVYYCPSCRMLTGLTASFTDDYTPYAGRLGAGTYLASATMLWAMYLPGAGRWDEELEREYRSTLAALPTAPREVLLRFADLRTARLMALLRTRQPVGEIGHSILAYALADGDLAEFNAVGSHRPPGGPAGEDQTR